MNFFLSVTILAGAVWGLVFALRGSLMAGCLAFLVLTCCFSHEFLNFDLGPIPLTLDRIWVVLLGVMYLIHRESAGATPSRWLRSIMCCCVSSR